MYRRRRRMRMRSSFRRRGITRRIRRRVRIKSAKRGLFLRPRTRAYTEVKYADSYLASKGVTCENRSTGTGLGACILFGQLLEIIQQGTNRNQRIGNKIHVKKISLTINASLCGLLIAATYRQINSAMLRVMCTNLEGGPPGGPYTDVANFWSVALITDKMICPINRRNFDVYYDKVFPITSGYPNVSDPALSSRTAGLSKLIKISIPINRTIEFTDDNKVKECTDNYTISAYSSFPNHLDFTTTQYLPVCLNAHMRVYYTDN